MTPVVREAIRRILPRRTRAHRIRRGPLAGSLIYTSWHDYPGAIRGTTENALLEWFAGHVRKGETWLDVGAHYGYTAIALAKLVGNRGRVFAFEPVVATAGCAARTADLNGLSQLRIVPIGLSSTPGMRMLRVPVVRGMAENGLPESDRATAATRATTVVVSCFDDLWASLCGSRPLVHGVKIDVQGMEASVLSGMKALLRRCHPKLVVEFHAGVDRGNLIDFLRTCGYDSVPRSIGRRGTASTIEDNRSYEFVTCH